MFNLMVVGATTCCISVLHQFSIWPLPFHLSIYKILYSLETIFQINADSITVTVKRILSGLIFLIVLHQWLIHRQRLLRMRHWKGELSRSNFVLEKRGQKCLRTMIKELTRSLLDRLRLWTNRQQYQTQPWFCPNSSITPWTCLSPHLEVTEAKGLTC